MEVIMTWECEKTNRAVVYLHNWTLLDEGILDILSLGVCFPIQVANKDIAVQSFVLNTNVEVDDSFKAVVWKSLVRKTERAAYSST